MAIFPKFSFSPFCHFSPGEKVFLPYRQKLGNYRGFYRVGEKSANPDLVYKDDNARLHRARMETEEIERMEWPTVSRDMNPIENMWSEVTRTMDASANQPTNLAELQQAVIDAWQALRLQTLATLIDNMPRRVQALYDARGGHTKY